ncbi:bifunctional 4-hydroxy-2-oxoglutarate aldolase/2-dehydro-3-deoxy-phosphogluconate aldolase [Kribbella pratensis]|jgi:2-dehydro-3-deoxyphosphogluconate aldolase/(4S)-4-hydroxy-2-oxoglutarate aldolase|uniref:2-dehydro-3-deoxyphosphogluconate aldolase/(4S)-4-hydroxy-2-oxoglutarate aldolase n=1 Tax=Kribbella pratensis TaxID=2512112 RepID=A0A4R8BYK1_9ACTN|nr:bifunctional 4-hydroxy-2-oxoglutarate aldolase/2-dehydro-3-deoxy-phosphogluconate aldolase [Kribbella pratensis]TDW66696.1 2-dehydro-3-deoxyphosphogluconate aldolase/(4S)-4-hydroxy-2-oxoglutarate aldolase [Kribbella pratensis]
MDLLAELRTRKLLAIIRADGADTALACVETLVEAGVTALEISLTTPGGVEAIAKARSQYDPHILIGAGTVVTAAQADEVAAARAGFVVTPAITRGAHRAVELGLPLLCGALTPTEVVAALDLGATAVKIFPAKLHGPGYFSELLAPLPDAPLIAVGGVDAQSAPRYLAAGALAVGVGSPLLGDAGTGGSLAELAIRASTFRTELDV